MNFNILKMVYVFFLLFSFCQTLLITILVKYNFYDYLSFAKSLINFVCFTDIDECSPNPCEHGGQCVQTLNASYVCGCAAGYTGVNCSDGKNLFFTVYQHTILFPTAVCTTTTIGRF